MPPGNTGRPALSGAPRPRRDSWTSGSPSGVPELEPAMESKPVDRRALERGFIRWALIAVVAAALLLAAGVAFGWTLTEAPYFGLTTDPAGALPF